MKMLWSTVSFLAVVHLFALLLFLGWLWKSDRLNGDRIGQLREMFSNTITESEQAARDAEQVDEPDSQSMLTRLSSAEQLGLLTTLQEQELQSSRRMKDESEILARQFEIFSRQTESQRAEFERERENWEAATGAERERKADEQFAQTVQQYETLPAKQCKEMLMELVNQGRREQAVAYLDAMKPRVASKILKEFKSRDEIVLATELLEDLRTFGLGTVDPQESSDDDDAANDKQSAS